MNRKYQIALSVVVAAFLTACATPLPSSADLDKLTLEIVGRSFRDQGQAKLDRLNPDEDNRLCVESEITGVDLSDKVISEIEARNMKTIKAPADGSLRILFACQRFREGSDVKGLEMTCALVGNTTAVYILLQICGRALRLDFEGKEGWCLIVRPSEQGTTEEDVLASIILDIFEFLGDSNKKREIKEIEPLIKTFL
jgi:hypothetical protein